ncbi:hypothetical protein QFC21_001040 [Naganishia friedmannii]|uniref:Uncharacterized protein n=1 Tax=Naganishia friedmannii TaxID=89922 RepID=A0ACC2W963_9TREE|nr:hypothetical protein QFC21_001040 [Naganishia friedmannii]
MSVDELSNTEDRLDEWMAFLKDYAAGRGVTSADIPDIPAFLSGQPFDTRRGSVDNHQFASDTPAYDSEHITPDVARRIRDYYIKNKFLPPPRHPLEHLRMAIIQDYDLHHREQVQSIQSTLNVLQAVYGGAVAFTLFEQDIQVLNSVSGPPELLEALDLYQGKRIIPETSLCGHAALSSGAIFVPDFENDWRYSQNPFASDASPSAKEYINTQVSLAGYVGIPVTLLLEPALPEESSVVTIGVINLLITNPEVAARMREPGHTMVLREITRMLQTQLRATWDCNRRSKDSQMRRSISAFIEHTLARPCAQLIANRMKDLSVESDSLKEFAELACAQIREVLPEAEMAMIVDLRTPSCIVDSQKVPPLSLLALDGSLPAVSDVQGKVTLSASSGALQTFLKARQNHTCAATEQLPCIFGPNSSGLECFLPAGTKSQLVVPFTSSGAVIGSSTEEQYVFLVVVTSARPSYQFASMEFNFVQSIGGILRAHWLQSRVVEADAAKTRFLSSISHELRTPLHCIINGLGLLQEAMADMPSAHCDEYFQLLNQSSNLLDQVLNQILDYGTITQTVTDQHLIRDEEFDLAQAVTLAVQTSLPRMHRHVKGEKDVEILVEYEDRNWAVRSDATAFKRILVNGVTNALKATHRGQILIKLEAMLDGRGIVCQIIDTGKGVSADIADKIFLPFVKGDPWIPGAGLGLNITQGLVGRMKGVVQLIPNRDCGMTFRVELLIHLLTPSTTDTGTALPLIRQLIHRNMTLTEYTDARAGRILNTKVRLNSEISSSDSGSITGSDTTDGPPKTPGAGEGKASKLRVLVVDDNEIGRKLVRRAIDNGTIDIKDADDGGKAFEVYKTFAPHLVLTDIGMPFDGIKLAKEIRAFEAQTARRRARIYAITGLGSTDPRLAEDGLQGAAQLDGWLTKGKHGFLDFRKIVNDTLNEVQREKQATLLTKGNNKNNSMASDGEKPHGASDTA